MTEPISPTFETSTKRPVLLTLLCILSFIGNGFMVILGMAGIFTSGYIARLMEEYSKGYENLGREMLLIFSFSVLLVFGLKLWGVILMFFRRKGGYILYLIPTGLLMILNIVTLFATYHPIVAGYLVVSIVFIVLYGVFLKYMK
jgi:hypothetical protein